MWQQASKREQDALVLPFDYLDRQTGLDKNQTYGNVIKIYVSLCPFKKAGILLVYSLSALRILAEISTKYIKFYSALHQQVVEFCGIRLRSNVGFPPCFRPFIRRPRRFLKSSCSEELIFLEDYASLFQKFWSSSLLMKVSKLVSKHKICTTSVSRKKETLQEVVPSIWFRNWYSHFNVGTATFFDCLFIVTMSLHQIKLLQIYKETC